MSVPFNAEFLMQVNCRHVPAFFLGCVFMAAAANSASFLRNLFSRLRQSVLSAEEVEHLDSVSEKPGSDTDSAFSVCTGESRTLVFIVSFCFTSASITLFASLLSFSIGAGAACAFVVAWGGIASQLARIVGLIILLLEMRRLGVQRRELLFVNVFCVVATASVFVNSAFATGVTRSFPEWGVALCERKHSIPTSLTSSLLFILLETYIIYRFWSLLGSGLSSSQSLLETMQDFRVFRGTALLLFELLNLVPSAIPINIIADFLPYTIGALLVIWAFCFQARSSPNILLTSPISAPSLQSSHSVPRLSQVPPTIYSGGYSESSAETPRLHHHPFASKSLEDSSRQSDWNIPRIARSSSTIDSLSTNSVHNAVVQVAKRAAHPFDYSLERLPTPNSAMPDIYSRVATPAVPVSSPSRIVHSQNTLADMLDLNTKMPPKAVARPRLVVVTNSIGDKFEASQPSSTVVPRRSMMMQQSALFRLTPTFVPTESSHLSMSSSESRSDSNGSHPSQSSRSLPSSPLAPRNSVFSVPRPVYEEATGLPDVDVEPKDGGVGRLSRTTTFHDMGGTNFRAAGYRNPIQNRWTHLPHRSLVLPSRPHPLPIPAEWPAPPSTLPVSGTVKYSTTTTTNLYI